MSFHVNFTTHGQELNAAYQAVISEKDDTNWLIYAYDKGTYDLRVQATGDGGLEELNDEFSDGKVQFAYAKVIDPNTELPKFVFVGWCGSGVPELRKAFFNSQLSDVSKFFKSFHVQINARDEADVEPELIMKRVAESSGANYSVHKESAKPQARVTPVGSVYKKTEIPNIAAMQRESMTKENAPKPVGTNYTPVQTTPKKMEQRWNMAQNQDSGANAVRAERERFEKEVRDREIQKAKIQQPQQDDESDRLQAEAEAAARREQEDADRRRREQEAEERRIREQENEMARQREQEEERQRQQQQQQEQEERQRQEQEEYHRRQAEQEENERRQQQQEEEEKRRRQEQEEQERQRREAEREEDERREAAERQHRQQQEEEEEKERQRQEEKALQSQLDQTADRAVHASQAAGAAAAAPSGSHQGVSAVVLFEYEASETNEMSLLEGEVVTQIDQVDEGWWFGVSEDGKKQGLFPANYVQILEQEEQPAAAAAATADIPAAPPVPVHPEEPKQQQQQNQGNVAVALYDYSAEEDNEISFAEGDTITQIEFVSEDWWQGLAANGKTVGLFPANYVELKQ
ncbi:actin binding protein [Mucor circinelloides]